jgi:hypothetical protein
MYVKRDQSLTNGNGGFLSHTAFICEMKYIEGERARERREKSHLNIGFTNNTKFDSVRESFEGAFNQFAKLIGKRSFKRRERDEKCQSPTFWVVHCVGEIKFQTPFATS